MTAQSGDQRHVHTGSRRHTSTAATISSKTRCNFISKKAVKVTASVIVALAFVLFVTVTFDRDDPKKSAAVGGRDNHDLAGNGKRSALDIPVTPLLPRLSQMRLRRGFLRGDNERASKDSSDELEDRDTIQALLSSLEERREESFDIVTRDADAALKAADDAVKAGVVAVAAAAEEASDVSTGMT